MGNLVQVTEPAPEGGTHESYYTYNIYNQLTNVSMPRGAVTQTRTFNYDLATGRLTSATNPENGTVTYSYNGNGTLAYKIDAKNQRSDYTYDSYGRLAEAAGMTYYYDTNPFDASFSENSWGRVAAVRYSGDPRRNVTEMYSYARGGAMVRKRVKISGIDFDAWFAYDNQGRYLGPWKYPGGYSPEYTYTLDTLSRPIKLTAGPLNPGDNPKELGKEVVYGPGSEVTQLRISGDVSTHFDDLVEARIYNTLGQMTRLTVPGRIDQEYRYTAGQNNGRISQMKDWISGEEVTYSYDSLNRLIQAVTTGPEYGLNFSYDGFGNMKTQHAFKGPAFDTNLGYSGLTNRITSGGYGYDTNGNLTAMPYLSMTYDVQNRMIESTHTVNGDYQYGYDPGGRRVWSGRPQTGQTGDTTYVDFYGPDGLLLSKCQVRLDIGIGETGSCLTERVYFAGRLIRSQSAPYQRLLEDGTPWVERTSESAITSDRLGSTGKYYPYGYLRSGSGGMYATYTRDAGMDTAATGLDNAVHRHYSSAIGRFTTPDPYQASGGAGDPQSWNRYSYAWNDPINYNDPDGQLPMTVISSAPYLPGNEIPNPNYVPNIGFFIATWMRDYPPPADIVGFDPRDYYAARADQRARGRLAVAKGLVEAALDKSDCLDLFGTPPDLGSGLFGMGPTPTAKEVFQSIISGGTYGQLTFGTFGEKQVNAQTTPSLASLRILSSPDVVFTYNSIVINSSTNSKLRGSDAWNFGSPVDNAVTLLHELGHVLRNMGWTGGVFNHTDGNPIVNSINTQYIKYRCGKYF